MVCSHCGKVLDNDKLAFCVYCGYPLKGSKKGFFAKSEETGTSRAEEYARAESVQPAPEPPVQQVKPAAAAPAPQPVQQPMTNSVQPMMPGMQGVAPQMGGVQPIMPGIPGTPQMGAAAQPVMPGMGAVQPAMMPGTIPQMGAGMMGMPMQQPVQGMEMPAAVPQMPYGMPQMGYTIPQMQYGMPQFAGYDAAGNPVYMQMMPQLVGYDAYGNPLYNMVAMPYMMPNMQGMPAMQPMQQPAPMYQNEPVIDVPQEQIRPAESIQPAPAPAMQAASMPSAVPPVTQSAPVQPAPMQQASMQSVPAPQPEPSPATPPAPEPMGMDTERRVEISSAEDLPMDADHLMEDEEDAAQLKQQLPDEETLLNSIFSDAPKSYTMSEGVKPAAATFSINLSASEIINVRDEEISAPPLPPVPTLNAEKAEKPKRPAAPRPEKPKVEKPDKKLLEEMAKAEKERLRIEKEREKEKVKAEKERAKEEKAKAAAKKKQPVKKAPATIVSPEDFFDDKKPSRRDTLSVRDLEALDDEQLTAHLHSMQSTTGGKKSTRSMKAASHDEMDFSNIEVEALLGSKKSGLPH